MGKLEELTKQLDYVWEDMIYDPCTLLPTLFEVDNVDAKWLPYLKPQLGFTADLSFDATTEELRRLLALAVPYWNEKPTEAGVINNAIRMVTGNRFRVQNWFDFRMQEAKTCITEELEDFDPYAIGFLSNKFSGTNGVLGEAGLFFFNLNDLTDNDGEDYDFVNPSDWGWLSVDSDPAQPTNEGIYQIDYVIPETKHGYLRTPIAVAHAGPVEYRIWGHMEEHVSEVRLVDPGVGTLPIKDVTGAFTVGQRALGGTSGAYGVITAVGTTTLSLRSIYGRFEPLETVTDPLGGSATVLSKMSDVLNRDLLDFLMGGRTVRPFSERINIVYINFLDQFKTPGDLDQWEVNDATLVSVPSPGGPCRFLATGRIQSDDSTQDWWEDQVVAWKIVPTHVDSVIHLTFMGTDDDDHYYVKMDYSAKELELYKTVGGTPTQLGSTISLSYLKVDVQDVVRVDALAEGSGTRIRVKVNGETELDENDSAGSFSAGRVGAYAAAETFDLELVEVNVLPTEVGRVGPNP